MKRNSKGQYMSKEQVARRELRKLMALILLTIVFGIASHYAQLSAVVDTGWLTPQDVEAAVWVPQIDPCGLTYVICDNEQQVVDAVTAVENALGHAVTDETKRRVQYLYERTQGSGVPFTAAVKTVYCESMWQSVQSGVVRHGKQENSWGLSQISLDHHKNVTRDQAMDARFAIDFMVENWYTTVWYGYDRETGECTNGLVINL